MANFTAEQERHAACILCPHRSPNSIHTNPCKKQNCGCTIKQMNDLRRSKKYRKSILAICHWLYDKDLHYFKIKE